MTEFLEVSVEQLRQLIEDSIFLQNLYAAGIDNAEAFDEAERVDPQDVEVALGYFR